MLQNLFKALALSVCLTVGLGAGRARAMDAWFSTSPSGPLELLGPINPLGGSALLPAEGGEGYKLYYSSSDMCDANDLNHDGPAIETLRRATGLDAWLGKASRVWLMVPSGFNRDAYLQEMIKVRNGLGLSKADLPFYAPHDPAGQSIMTYKKYLSARTLKILSSNQKKFQKIPERFPSASPSVFTAFMQELTGLDCWLSSAEDQPVVSIHIPTKLSRCRVLKDFVAARDAAGVPHELVSFLTPEQSPSSKGALSNEIQVPVVGLTPGVMKRLASQSALFRRALGSVSSASPTRKGPSSFVPEERPSMPSP